MKVLIKDHKDWKFGSGKTIPSRPVVNGRGGYNTHLSEILSHILEPIALEMTGAEVDSTEQALAAFELVNTKIKTDPEWKNYDTFPNILNSVNNSFDRFPHPKNVDSLTVESNIDVKVGGVNTAVPLYENGSSAI